MKESNLKYVFKKITEINYFSTRKKIKNIIVSGIIGMILGIMASIGVNSTLITISLNPFFAMVYFLE